MAWWTTFRMALRARRAASSRTAAGLSAVDGRAGGGGWWPIVRESYAGAWQQNVSVTAETVLAHAAVYACITLIASDIGKLRIRLVEQDDDGIWQETENTAHSPFLRKPNRYQTRIKFYEQWVTSKLIHGNTYVIKQRDQRGRRDGAATSSTRRASRRWWRPMAGCTTRSRAICSPKSPTMSSSRPPRSFMT